MNNHIEISNRELLTEIKQLKKDNALLKKQLAQLYQAPVYQAPVVLKWTKQKNQPASNNSPDADNISAYSVDDLLIHPEQLKAEQSLREQRDFNNSLIDTAQEIIVVLDLEGKLLRINKFFENISGYHLEEIKNKDAILTFLHKKIHDDARNLLNSVIHKDQIVKKVYPLLSKTNTQHFIEWHVKAIKDSNGKINSILAIGCDITQRLHTEAALISSKARYKDLFESSPVPLWEEDFSDLLNYFSLLKKQGVKDFQQFFTDHPEQLISCAKKIKIININNATLQLYQLQHKNELTGSLNNIFRNNIPFAEFKDEMITFASGGRQFETETRIQLLNGNVKHLDIKIHLKENEYGQTKALIATLDITEQKHSQEVLYRYQKILSCVAEVSKDFLLSNKWQLLINQTLSMLGEAAGVSRVYVFQNSSNEDGQICTSQLYEWCATEIIPQIDNPDLQNFNWYKSGMQQWYEQLSNNKVVNRQCSDFTSVEHALLDYQNIYSILLVPLFVNKQFWGTIGFDDCINERRWTDMEIAALESAAGVISGAIEREHSKQALRESEQRFRGLVESTNDWIWEIDKQGLYIYSSPSVNKMLGYEAEEIIGKSPFDFMPEEQADNLKNRFIQLISQQQSFANHETLMLHKNGDLVSIETNSVPIVNDTGKIIGIYGIDRDISERKQMEQTRLKQSEKQKYELIREVHHRIKNHLQGLIGLLQQRGSESLEYKAIINETITQIESIAIIYGLQSTHHNAQIFFSQMVNAIINSTSCLTDISFLITHGEESGLCEVDRNKAVALALVVNELIINAIKHFNDTFKQPNILIKHKHQKKQIIFTVINPGRLPENFNYDTGSGLGTGLGLLKAMLPRKGAKLSIKNINNEVIAQLTICTPLLVNVKAEREK